MSFSIDITRLQGEIDALATISEVPAPAVTRVLFSPKDLEARVWLTQRCQEVGLKVRHDAIGNFFARWEGSQLELPPIATGSHIDAIPNAGRFDGVVGVLGALEAIRALRASGFTPRRSIELILFTAEEPTRFGIGCLGSRLLSGVLSPKQATALKDKDGIDLEAWRAQASLNNAPLSSVPLTAGCYGAFIELHIEQGPLLERDGIDIGVVEKIAAPSAFRFRLEGSGGHAGAVLMPGRRDALLAGCEIALAAEEAALHSGSPDTVATTGVFKIEPGAINSIPFRALLEIDLRDTDLASRDRVLEKIKVAAEEICKRRTIELGFEQINRDPPAVADRALVASALKHAKESGFSAQTMISRAYHDSLFMALLCPMTMIFIPCRGGVSHRPDEYSSPAQIEAGVVTLAKVLQEWSAR